MKQFVVTLKFIYDEEPDLIETEEDAIQQAIEEIQSQGPGGFEYDVEVY